MEFTRENYRMMREELLKTVYWKDDDTTPKRRALDRVEAAQSVAMLNLALLKAEIETGMYKKPVEMLEGNSLRAIARRHARGRHRGLDAGRIAS